MAALIRLSYAFCKSRLSLKNERLVRRCRNVVMSRSIT